MTPKKGFTLVELLVAASILGIIGLVILTTFGSGFHVFERVQAFGGAQADVLLALEEMEKDIANLLPYGAIPFEGDAESIAFPAIIEMADPEDEDSLISTLGRISYYIDDAAYLNQSGKVLLRGEQNYSDGSNDYQFNDDDSQVLAYVESIAFEYFSYNEESEAYAWQSSWGSEEENLLSGIKVAVTYKDGDQDVVIERAAFMPTIQKIFDIEDDEESEDDDDDDDDEGEGEEGE